ncbi:hypothetical protein D3C85_1516990 [compost metagenome]
MQVGAQPEMEFNKLIVMNGHEVLLCFGRINVEIPGLWNLPAAFADRHHSMEHECALRVRTIAAVLTSLCAGLGSTTFWPLFYQYIGRQVDVRVLIGEC